MLVLSEEITAPRETPFCRRKTTNKSKFAFGTLAEPRCSFEYSIFFFLFPVKNMELHWFFFCKYICICIYLLICNIFAFFFHCFALFFLSFFSSLPVTAWGRLNKTQMMANYQELHSVFVWTQLIFISVCKTFALKYCMFINIFLLLLKKKKKHLLNCLNNDKYYVKWKS